MLPIALCCIFLASAAPQGRGVGRPTVGGDPDQPELKLPSGKSQREEILKSDFAKSKAEAAKLVKLTQEMQAELEKGRHQVLDLKLVKKAEEIERLARRIKDRLRRFY